MIWIEGSVLSVRLDKTTTSPETTVWSPSQETVFPRKSAMGLSATAGEASRRIKPRRITRRRPERILNPLMQELPKDGSEWLGNAVVGEIYNVRGIRVWSDSNHRANGWERPAFSFPL